MLTYACLQATINPFRKSIISGTFVTPTSGFSSSWMDSSQVKCSTSRLMYILLQSHLQSPGSSPSWCMHAVCKCREGNVLDNPQQWESKAGEKGLSLVYMLLRKSGAIELPFLIAVSLIMSPYTDFLPSPSHLVFSHLFLGSHPQWTAYTKAYFQTSAFKGTQTKRQD